MPDIQAITAPVAIPDLSEVKDEQAALIERGRTGIVRVNGQIVISSVEEQAFALTLLRDIRGNVKAAKAKFQLVKGPMVLAKKAVDAWEHEVTDQWEAMDSQISAANSAFITRQKQEADRIAREAQKKAQDEADKIARERAEKLRAEREARALEEAAKLEARGFAGAADAALEAEIAAPPEVVVPEVVAPIAAVPIERARVAGINSRTSYSCEIEDFAALVKWCLENPALLDTYLTPNMTALNGRARSSKEQFKIPGCKLITKYV